MLLEEICTVFSGYAFKNFNDDCIGIPVIKIGNINVAGKINTKNCQYTTDIPNDKFLSLIGDIYIALSGATTGKIGLMNQEGFYINQRVGIIRTKNNIVPIQYLKYFLQSKTNKILNDALGAAQPNISPKDISKYEIPIKTSSEMISIFNDLSNIEELIKTNTNQLLSLNDLIKSRFISQEASHAK